MIVLRQAPYILSAFIFLFSLFFFLTPAVFRSSLHLSSGIMITIMTALVFYICYVFFRSVFCYKYCLKLAILASGKKFNLRPSIFAVLSPLMINMLMKNNRVIESAADSFTGFYESKIEALVKVSTIVAGPLLMIGAGFLGIGLILAL